jgi:glycosyltransferase involved in cell wall biosynthesis
LKILLIHNKYQHQGGEDTVVQQENDLLRENYIVDTLFFQNQKGIKGAFQFLCSIWNVFAAQTLRKKIKSFQPDVIHVHNWHFASGPILFRVAKKLNIPVVHTVHNYRLLCPSAILLHNNELFTDSLYQNFPWTAVRKRVYRDSRFQTFWLAFIVWFHKKIGTWNSIDKYICLTPFAVELFQQSKIGLDESKFTVKPNFTKNSSELTEIAREDHFLFIGRLSEEKGVQTLLETFKASIHQLRIAGDGPMKEQVLEAQNEFENIQYLGSLSKEEVIREMKRTQALIFPSICFETFGMTLIEAYSCSTPVIASEIGAPKALVKHKITGLLFNPGDSEDLLLKIDQFVAMSKEEKKTMQQNAFNTYKQKYSAEKQTEYFKEIYSFN